MDTLSLSKGPLTPARILTPSYPPFMGLRGTDSLLSSPSNVASTHHYSNENHYYNQQPDIAVLMRQLEETAAHFFLDKREGGLKMLLQFKTTVLYCNIF